MIIVGTETIFNVCYPTLEKAMEKYKTLSSIQKSLAHIQHW